jgi:hypothetical protein
MFTQVAFFRVAGPLARPDTGEKSMTVTESREIAEEPGAGQPGEPRLRLRPDRSGPALLDGGWWPRSADPAAELPGLIFALDKWNGRVTRLMLGTAGWDASRPSRLRVASAAGHRVVRLGWFATMPVGLLTAISATGQRTDLVTVPPQTGEREAAAALEQALTAGNRDHAPEILAAISEAGAEPGD